jgi:Flp pilus assembly protein TadG
VRVIRRTVCQLGRLRADTSGNTAVLFAAAAVVLMIAIGAAVDIGRWLHARDQTMAAVDAAVLAGGRYLQTNTTDTDGAIEAATRYYDQNVTSRLPVVDDTVGFKVADDGMGITAQGSAYITTPFLKFANVERLPLISTAQTDFAESRIAVGGNGGQNIEVSLILDVTGSMLDETAGTNGKKSTKIADLKAAAKDLINTIVWDDQSEFTSKVALVPYSMGVNVGDYADKVRGAPPAGKSITGATKANPVVITAASHGFNTGDVVYITGVSGMTQINNKTFTITKKSSSTFSLNNTNGTNYSTFKSSTSGKAFCTTDGCEYRYFLNSSNQGKLFNKSTCVSERKGGDAYTDTAPGSSPVGRNYPSTSNQCLTSKIVPLSKDKTSLNATVDALVATGSTAGQIGVAWGWYLLSPEFGSLWSSADSVPASYADLKKLGPKGQPILQKIAVLMTDGDFNTAYCDGVISKDSGSGSGSSSDHINCNANNGSPNTQATDLCTAMKAKGVTVYTVGFDVGNLASAKSIMEQCATDSTKVYIADNGEQLKQAFRDIALKLSSLYISK